MDLKVVIIPCCCRERGQSTGSEQPRNRHMRLDPSQSSKWNDMFIFLMLFQFHFAFYCEISITLATVCVCSFRLCSAWNHASTRQACMDSGALLVFWLTTLRSHIRQKNSYIYSGTGAAPVRRGSPPPPTAVRAISINQSWAQKATGEKTRPKSGLKFQIDVKHDDLWPLPSWKCPGVENTGLGRQPHSWGLMQKRRMTIRTADGDVPREINPQHGWRAPESLITPPPPKKKERNKGISEGHFYSNNIKAVKDGEGFP